MGKFVVGGFTFLAGAAMAIVCVISGFIAGFTAGAYSKTRTPEHKEEEEIYGE